MESAIPAEVDSPYMIGDVYASAPFFMTRTALLPHDMLQAIGSLDEDLYRFYVDTPLFQEAIAIASPSLYETLKGLMANFSKTHLAKVAPALRKYFLRMTTRVTPFGLFSCVGWGAFDTQAHLAFDRANVQKRVRTDMVWVQSLVERAYADMACVRTMSVMVTPLLLRRGDRCLVFQLEKANETTALISIRNTKIVEKILSLAQVPIVYRDLEEALFQAFPEYDVEKLSLCLHQVFENGFLISELTPQLHQCFSLQACQEHLPDNDAILIDQVEELMQKYQSMSIGEGVLCFEQLSLLLNQQKNIPYPLQVDSYTEAPFHLPASVQPLLEKIAGIFFVFTKREPNAWFKQYQAQFSEKYGLCRLVPISEVIDEQLGIGLPPIDGEENGPLCNERLVSALLSSHVGQEVVLDEWIDNYHIVEKDVSAIPPSMELCFELQASSFDALQQDDYTVIMNPVLSTCQAGSIFGRFLPLFSQDKKEAMEQFLAQEEGLLPGISFVEASFVPNNSRVANVCFYTKTRPFQLLLHYHEPSSSTLSLDDIYVGATLDRLYLYSKKLHKEIYVHLNSAVNPALAPPLLKVILGISRAGFASISPSLWLSSDSIAYLPRIRYRNAILFPARWCFSYQTLHIDSDTSKEKVAILLQQAVLAAQVPQTVFLTIFDQRLKLDITLPANFELLVKQLMSHKEIFLFEANISMTGGMAHSQAGCHVTEFVLPFVRKIPITTRDLIQFPEYIPVPQKTRYALPGGEWLYIKLFLPYEREEAFLLQQILPYIQHLYAQQVLDSWFYIRYKEEKSHIRLRLKSVEGARGVLFEQLHGWVEQVLEMGMIANLSIQPYEREVERYGGEKSIYGAEAFFCSDSLCVMALLSMVESKAVPIMVLAALGVIHIVSCACDSIESMAQFLSPAQKHSALLVGFREEMAKMVAMAKLLFVGGDWHAASSQLEAIASAFASTEEPLLHFLSQLPIRYTKETSAYTDVVESLIHMRCNRLLGIDQELERRARVLAYTIVKKMSHEKAQDVR